MANKYRSFLAFILIVLISFSSLANTEISNPADLFAQGNKFYLEKDYSKAAELFNQVLDKDRSNAAVLTNLALAQFNLEKKSVSLGLLRKALAIDPEFETAKNALNFVISQMQIKEVPRKIETYESFRSVLIQPVPLSAYMMLSAISLFAAGWVLITFSARRKKALSEEQAPPSFPFVGAFLSLIFITTTSLLGFKIYDSNQVRGTLIEDQVSVLTAPGNNGVSILDLYGGMEVIVNSTQDEWVQITYPGSLTGWIKKSALLMTR